MKYCKYCGRELPESGVCGCIESITALGPNDRQTAAEGDTELTGAKKFISDKKWFIVGGIAVLWIFILVIALLVNFTGPRGVTRKFAKNIYSSKGGKTYYSMILPDKLYSSLKGDKLDAMVDEFNDDNKKANEDYKIKLKRIKKADKLNSRQLDGAEKMFAETAAMYDSSYKDKEFTAKKGYIYKVTYKIKDRQSKKTKKYTNEFAVVKFKGEGWKIVGMVNSTAEDDIGEILSKAGSGSSETAKSFGF